MIVALLLLIFGIAFLIDGFRFKGKGVFNQRIPMWPGGWAFYKKKLTGKKAEKAANINILIGAILIIVSIILF